MLLLFACVNFDKMLQATRPQDSHRTQTVQPAAGFAKAPQRQRVGFRSKLKEIRKDSSQ